MITQEREDKNDVIKNRTTERMKDLYYLVHCAAPTGPWTSTVTSSYTLVIHDNLYVGGFSLRVASSSKDLLVHPSLFFKIYDKFRRVG